LSIGDKSKESIMRALLLVCLGSVFLAWMGCGGEGDLVDRFCNANCKKLGECNMLNGMTVEACVSNCTDSGQQNIGKGCTPSASAVDACLKAIEAASCPFSTPAACQNMCEGQQTTEQVTTGDAGGGGDMTSSGDTGNGSSGGCGVVQGSCVQKKNGETQCQEYSGQLTIVLTNLRQKCREGETTTWYDAPCKTSAPGMNYACERNSPGGCVTSYASLDAQAKAAAEQGCVMGGGKVVTP
jgi:hypothetical protein